MRYRQYEAHDTGQHVAGRRTDSDGSAAERLRGRVRRGVWTRALGAVAFGVLTALASRIVLDSPFVGSARCFAARRLPPTITIPIGRAEINIKRMQKDRTMVCAVPRLFLLALGPRIVTPPPGYAYGNSVHLAHADERKADEHGHPAAGGRLGGRLP